MSFSKFFPLLMSTLAFSATAAVEGPAQVEILDRLAVGIISFEGEAAENLYHRLQVLPMAGANGVTEKIGLNIACSEETRMGSDPSLARGEVDTGSHKAYRCGLLLDSASGAASPSRVVGPTPGFSIGN